MALFRMKGASWPAAAGRGVLALVVGILLGLQAGYRVAPAVIARVTTSAATTATSAPPWQSRPDSGPVPVIPMAIDGTPIPGGCLVDTGSYVTLLSQTVAAPLALRRVDGVAPTRLTGFLPELTVDAVPMVARHMGNADWQWHDIQVWVVPRSTFPCILGTDLLASPHGGSRRLRFDWTAQRVTPD